MLPNDRQPNEEQSNGAPRDESPRNEVNARLDAQSAELLTRVLSAPAPDPGFVESLGERLQGEFALIHGLEGRNGYAAQEQEEDSFEGDAIAGSIEQARRPSLRRWLTVAAASLLIGAVFWSGQSSYSWAGMVEAMSRQPWVHSELIESGVVRVRRWVSTEWTQGEGGVVASDSNGAVRYADSRAGFALSLPENGKQIIKDPLANEDRKGDWRWLVDSLLGAAGEGPSHDEWQFVEDSWRRGASYGGRDDLIELSVKFRAADGSLAEIQFLLDPKTELPVAARRVPSQAEGGKPASDGNELRFNFDDNGPESIYDLGAKQGTPIISREEHMVALRSGKNLLPPMATKATAPPAMVAGGGMPAAIETVIPDLVPIDDEAITAEAAVIPPWSPEPDDPLPAPMDDAELSAHVNTLLRKHWESIGVEPVGPASDEELLRRLQLDLTGRIPTVGEVRIFLEDTSPGRRERLVETLLSSRDHATHFASMWRRALIPRGVDLTPYGGPRKLEEWLADRVQRNVPHSELASELLLAEGRIRESGPLLFYAALKLNPEEIAAQTGRTFLGMRIECAQCHDHPFDDRIAQEDFWAFAANFARISRPRGMIEIASPVLRVADIDRGEVTMPDTETVVAPRLPLTDRQVLDAEGWPSRREQLVIWLTSPRNKRFARATVNRIWAHLFGRAIVEPIDDIRDDSTPLVPEVLDALAEDFARSGYDMRRLVRCLVMTDAYQLTSATTDEMVAADGPDKTDVFARMNIKPFSAEQLHDAIAVASRSAAGRGGADGGLVRFGDTSRDAFIRLFEAADNQSIDYQAGIPQALTLMHGQLTHGATDVSTSGMLRSLSAPFFSDQQRVETLFLATLSRLPSDAEREKMEAYVATAEDRDGRQRKLGDVLWALLNSAEFTLNH